jgi:putative addiction module component (TIGR02574 family)
MDTSLIERAALHLPVSARAELAHKLLLSLDNMSESEIEAAWFDEAERRANEIDLGIVQLIPAEEVSRKARNLLK